MYLQLGPDKRDTQTQPYSCFHARNCPAVNIVFAVPSAGLCQSNGEVDGVEVKGRGLHHGAIEASQGEVQFLDGHGQ